MYATIKKFNCKPNCEIPNFLLMQVHFTQGWRTKDWEIVNGWKFDIKCTMINVSWFNGLVVRSLQWVWRGGGPSNKLIFEVGMGANLLDHEPKKKTMIG
jgi:hypothetical protein